MIEIIISEDASTITVYSDTIPERIEINNPPAPSLTIKDGVPENPNVKQEIAKWLSQQDIPDDFGVQKSIELLADMEAGNFNVIDKREK